MNANKFGLLSQIKYPADFRKLSIEQLPEVCKELREDIIHEVSVNYGKTRLVPAELKQSGVRVVCPPRGRIIRLIYRAISPYIRVFDTLRPPRGRKNMFRFAVSRKSGIFATTRKR